VTVRLSDGLEWTESRKLIGTVVSPSEPRTKAGIYGIQVFNNTCEGPLVSSVSDPNSF